MKSVLTQGMQRCQPPEEDGSPGSKFKDKCNRRRKIFIQIFDLGVQVMQLLFFLITFSIITHHIINTEFNLERSNLQVNTEEFRTHSFSRVFFSGLRISSCQR